MSDGLVGRELAVAAHATCRDFDERQAGLLIGEVGAALMTAGVQLGGIHYANVKQLLLDDGVIIRGSNPGHTVFKSLQHAERWFEWVASGRFR